MPRTFDRRIPDVDKDPNRFGTDWSNPLGAIAATADEAGVQIRAGIIAAIKDATGIDLTGFVDFIDWLGAQINVNLNDLAANLAGIVAPIFETIDDILEALRIATGIDLSSGDAFLDWLLGLIGLDLRTLQSTLDGIGDSILDVADKVVDKIKDLTGLDLDALAALDPVKILAWLQKQVQEIIDKVAGLWKPISDPAAAIGRPLQDFVDAISGILGVANSAQSAADFANIGLAAITAANKAGFSDEFNYAIAANLPTVDWKSTYSGSGTGTWGPNGNGVLAWQPKGPVIVGNPRRVTYVQTKNPLPGIPATITLVLSKPPHEDALVKSWLHIDGQANATDQSCVRYWVGVDTAQFQTVNAAGAATNVGAAVAIPQVRAGDVFELVLNASTAVLKRNGIVAASSPYTPLAGRCIGFGAQTDAYTWIFGGHPAPEMAGIAWYP
jgi:hypothetical protein